MIDAGGRKGRSPVLIVLSLFAVVLVAMLGVYATIPLKQYKATAPPPDPTAQAIHDLQTSQQQASDQLKTLQQTVSSDRAERRRSKADGSMVIQGPTQIDGSGRGFGGFGNYRRLLEAIA
jgi:hypothetical protein